MTMAEEPSTSLEATQVTQGKDPSDSTKGLSGESPMSDEGRSSGLSDMEESTKSLLTPDKPRFSGAARKRFKWLMQHGHSVEEARSLALKPIPKTEKGPKRPRSEEGTPEAERKSKVAKAEEKSKPKPPKPLPYNKMANAVRIGVLHSNYPEVLLTTEQLKAVQEDILSKIIANKATDFKPKFVGSSLKPGWLSPL